MSICIFILASVDDLENNLLNEFERRLNDITEKYSTFVNCIRKSLKAKNVPAESLLLTLLPISAFDHYKQCITLLDTHAEELERASSVDGIFKILITQFSSFINCGIFDYLVKEYQLDNGEKEWKYSEDLKSFLEGLKVSEFININPLLKEYSQTTNCVLKVDCKATEKLAKIINLKRFVAKILQLNSIALQLVDIKEGCVVVTFLIKTPVAKIVFNEHTVFTEEQKKKFRELSVLWLTCNGHFYDFDFSA